MMLFELGGKIFEGSSKCMKFWAHKSTPMGRMSTCERIKREAAGEVFAPPPEKGYDVLDDGSWQCKHCNMIFDGANKARVYSRHKSKVPRIDMSTCEKIKRESAGEVVAVQPLEEKKYDVLSCGSWQCIDCETIFSIGDGATSMKRKFARHLSTANGMESLCKRAQDALFEDSEDED